MDINERPRKRARPALSCTDCKRRKIKCDRNTRCGNCVKSGTPCVYDAFLRGRSPAQQQELIQADRLGESRSTGLSITSIKRPVQIEVQRNVSDGARTIQSDSNQCYGLNRPRTTNDNQELLHRVERLEQLSGVQIESSSAEARSRFPLPQSRTQDSELIFTKTRISRWSDWMGINTQFFPTYACYTEALGISSHVTWQESNVRRLTVQIGDLLRSCKVLSLSTKSDLSSQNSDPINHNISISDRSVADTMIGLYFSHFESSYRILHIPTFWREYEEDWTHESTTSMVIRLKVHLTIAIGSVLHDSDVSYRNMTRQWVYEAERWLADPIEKQKLNVSLIQIHLLTILARQLLSIGGDFVWTSLGTLVNRAMQIGLHRDPKHLPKMTILQAETRRRLWTTILEMVLQSSLDSAMPPRLSLADFDSSPPMNVNDEEMDESTVSLHPHPDNAFTSTSTQLKLHSSIPLRLRILHVLTDLHNDLKYTEVLELSSQLSDACKQLTSFSEKHKQHGITQFHQNMISFMASRFMIPLHCPFIRKASDNPLFTYSLKTSIDASIAIVTPQQDRLYTKFMTTSGAYFKEAIRLSATIISLELFSQINEQRRNGTLHCHVQSRDHLKQALRNTIDMALARLRNGENNVKSHMFLSMILAQAEAMESGSPLEIETAKRGLESIQMCHEILRTRSSSGVNDEFVSMDIGDDFDFDMDFGAIEDFEF